MENDPATSSRPVEAPVPSSATGAARNKRYTLVQRVLREAGIGIALLLMILAFSTLAPHFTDESNITNILTQVTINLIMATGMTFVILVGGIDLSVGSVLAFSAMVGGLVLKTEGLPVPVAIILAVLSSVLVGMGCGFINGF
ncbi:MAG: ABC transporter permease, partial [Verrucomicrobia bacterium]|nr:ABC transporter permease [Verrucomicrobiota bacterium]